MVVRLRLARHGTRNNPFYHIVAINDFKARDARPIEKLGEYDPIPRSLPPPRGMDAVRRVVEEMRARKGKAKEEGALSSSSSSSPSAPADKLKTEKRVEWNVERIRYWLSVGAQPSKPVARLLDKAGLIPEGKHYKGIYRPPTTSASAAATGQQPASSSPLNFVEVATSYDRRRPTA